MRAERVLGIPEAELDVRKSRSSVRQAKNFGHHKAGCGRANDRHSNRFAGEFESAAGGKESSGDRTEFLTVSFLVPNLPNSGSLNGFMESV
jgi:hypothetical protein